MSKRPAKINVTINVETPEGRKFEFVTKMGKRQFDAIDELMTEAAKHYKVYTLTAPDGTIIAELV